MGREGGRCQLPGLGSGCVSADLGPGPGLWSPVSCSVLLPQINRMDYVEINIDHKFHRHLIGKSGANSEWGQHAEGRWGVLSRAPAGGRPRLLAGASPRAEVGLELMGLEVNVMSLVVKACRGPCPHSPARPAGVGSAIRHPHVRP